MVEYLSPKQMTRVQFLLPPYGEDHGIPPSFANAWSKGVPPSFANAWSKGVPPSLASDGVRFLQLPQFMNLKVKFRLNKSLDKKMAFEFLNIKAGGIDFSRGIISVHSELKIILKESKVKQKKIINKYFNKFYKNNKKYLDNRLKEMEKDWEKVEKKFIRQLEIIFKNPKVPKGKYIGYLSIINCNPRFLDDKTFQIFYKYPSGSNYVITHEILHFFFYDYAVKKYPKIFSKLDMNSGIFWDMAELFNAVIMSEPNFIIKDYSEKNKPYPSHIKYFNKAKEIWRKNKDIDNWLIEFYNYFRKIKKS